MPPAPGNLETAPLWSTLALSSLLRSSTSFQAWQESDAGNAMLQNQRAHGSWKRALRPRLQKSTAHGSNQCYMSDLALITILNRDHIVSHEDFMPVQFMHVSLYWSLYTPTWIDALAMCPSVCSPWHRRRGKAGCSSYTATSLISKRKICRDLFLAKQCLSTTLTVHILRIHFFRRRVPQNDGGHCLTS